MKNHSRKRGFTLVELLVVVTIIAIISGMAIVLVGGATDKAASTVSIATQKQLSDQINSYLQLHNGLMPDRFDTLIRADWPTTGATFTTLATNISVASDQANVATLMGITTPVTTTTLANVNRGIDPDCFSGANRTLTVKQMTGGLTTSATLFDVNNLVQIGITSLYDYNTGTLSNGRLGTTVRPTTLSVGYVPPASPPTPVCIIDPQSVAGQQLYTDFGVDLSNTTTYPRDASGELTAAGRLAALQAQQFYVFGLGTTVTMIGDRQLGLQEAPTSSVVTQGFYNRYLVVIKVGPGGNDRSVNFVGVLDPKGRGSSAARAANNAIR